MTLQKNSSNATRKRKFQEQSENQAISTTTNSSTTNNSSSRQQLQIQTEFQILQSLIPGLANQADISEVGVTFDFSFSKHIISLRN